MKKLLTLALALMMILSLTACGSNETPDPSGGGTDPGTSQQEPSGGTDLGTSQQEPSGGEQPSNTPDDSAPSGNDTPAPSGSSDSEGFSLPILERYDVFPPAEYWTSLGMPSDFTIEINEMTFSSKNSIYPLNATDGHMFDCVVADNMAAYTTLADSLWNAGINGVSANGGEITAASERSAVDIYDIDEHVYKAFWLKDGELMSIELRARDGSDKVIITVKYLPED